MVERTKQAKNHNSITNILLGSCFSLTLTVVGSIPLLSTTVRANISEATIAQQSEENTQDPTNVAAEKAFDEGKQLYEEGTAESLRKAIAKFGEALLLFKKIGNLNREVTTLKNIGVIYGDLGEEEKALNYFHQALPLFQQLKDKAEEAATLNNIGAIYNNLGVKEKAILYYNQALPLYQELGDRRGEAIIFHRMSFTYGDFGEMEKALFFYNKALPLFQEIGDRRRESSINFGIGVDYNNVGEYEKALSFYKKALSLDRQLGDRHREHGTLQVISIAYNNVGEYEKALKYVNQALSIRRQVGDRYWEAVALKIIAGIYKFQGEEEKALSFYNQALSLYQQLVDSHPISAFYSIAKIKRHQNKLTESLTFIEKTLEIVEDRRAQFNNPEFRTSYFARFQHYYQFYINLLMKLHQQQPNQGFEAKAFYASERSRARTFLELLKEAKIDVRQGIDSKLAAAEKNLQQKLASIEKQRLQLYNSKPTPEQEATFKRQRDNLNQRLDTLLAEYEIVRTKIRATNPRYDQLTQPQPLTMAEIQSSVLDDNTILLQYHLGNKTKRSYLWVVTKTSIDSYELLPTKEIEAATKEMLMSITNPRESLANVDKAADTLSEMILAPVASQLENKRLLIVSDGLLQYLPFATLSIPGTTAETDGYQPLLTKHQIVHSPSASTIANIRTETQNRQVANRTLAIIADPVFQPNDLRVQGEKVATTKALENVVSLQAQLINRGARDANITWQRLPGTRQEAQAIMKLLPESQRTHVFDFEANREMALSHELGEYKFVHFATHGFINGQKPERSGLVMSLVDKNGNWEDGFLRLNDIYNLNLPVEMVVLSACQTARGKNIRGEGLVSLTRGFMYAGAKRVVASLWNVDDAATADLMSEFYQGILEEGASPVEALRQAQLEIMNQQGWQHPYYWGAFTLQGEWK